MDFVKIFPPELTLKIFSFLPGEALWNSLSVSTCWKALANDEVLWRKLCFYCDVNFTEESLEKRRYRWPPLPKGPSYVDLCPHAEVWAVWRWNLVENWKKDFFYAWEIDIPDNYNFSISSSGESLAVSDGDQIFIFNEWRSRVISHQSDELSLRTIRSVDCNEHYLLVLLNHCVVVYLASDFMVHLVVNFVSGRLQIHKDDFSTVTSVNASVEFVLLHDHTLWVGEHLFVKSSFMIDIRTGEFRKVSFPWRCSLLKLKENVIARTDSLLAVYTLSGEKSFEMKVQEYSLINSSKNVLALITDHEIHTYNRLTGERIGLIKKSFFESNIDYKNDIIYCISKTEDRRKVSIEAISLLTGYVYWSVVRYGELTSQIHPILGGVYLLYSFANSDHWYILDSESGTNWNKKKLMKNSLLLYVSDFFWVAQTPKKIFIRFYF